MILPAQLEWGASIPNPGGRPVVIENARGMICQTLRTVDSASCSGPDGIRPDGMDRNVVGSLLHPGTNVGALITRTETGRTWFSVNGRKGRGFTRNQGFFEFDAKLN